MKLTGAELKNTIGNVAERFACADFNTGYSPAAAAVTAPTPEADTRFQPELIVQHTKFRSLA